MIKNFVVIVGVSLILVSCKNSGGTTDSIPDLAAKVSAATQTANSNSYCTAIAPYYWEIGNGSGVLVSGAAGDGSVTRTSVFAIASSSKWMFGAYAAEVLNGTIDATSAQFLTMSAGYTSFGNLSCSPNSILTVQDCYATGTNSTYTSGNLNKFYYNGGHFQKWGVDNGMASMTEAQLAADYKAKLAPSMSIVFGSPQLAGGIVTAASEYAKFLTRILNGNLKISNLLGSHAVCTLPSACATAVSSPIPEEWHYSLGHWIEDDPSTGDGSFSSAGLFGFYPWIDSSKTYYGMVSRYAVPTGGNEIGEGYASMLCGRLIRKAFMTGIAQ